MKNTTHILVIKYVVYSLLLLFLYVLQTTPGLFVIFGQKPMIVVPFAICIAMFEGEFVGGLFGAFAGLLCDIAGGMLFGFNGLFVAFFCIVTGLVVIYLMHCNPGAAFFFTLITMLVRGSVEFLFGYAIWNHPNVWRIFTNHTLPVILYTAAVAPLLFFLVKKIFLAFDKRIHPEIG